MAGQAHGTPLKSTHNSHLRILRELPSNESKSATIPGLMNNLLGLSPQCDAGCTFTLDKYATYVKYLGKTILTGCCDSMNGLWSCEQRTMHLNLQQNMWYYHHLWYNLVLTWRCVQSYPLYMSLSYQKMFFQIISGINASIRHQVPQ